jgi:hypothetical protein
MIEQLVIAEAKELRASSRWSNPDYPGSAGVKQLCHRVGASEQYSAFRDTPEGSFLLAVIESYEEALNDDLLPNAVCGLPLEHARTFIGLVADELESNTLESAVSRLKERHVQLGAL